MRVGIYTRYHYCEATHVAVRLADLAASLGHDVCFLADPHRPQAVSRRWDPLVSRTGPHGFTRWANRCDAVIWTHMPVPEQVSWVRRRNKLTVLAPLWHELTKRQRKTARAAHHIVAPSRSCGDWIKTSWQVRNCLIAPWDVGIPNTFREDMHDPSRYRLLIPAFDGAVTELPLVQFEDLLLARPDVDLTFAFTPSQARSMLRRWLQSLQRRFGERVSLQCAVPWHQRPLLFAQHDLTVWLAHRASTGFVGLTSLSMGTPVLSYSVSPLYEFLNTQNSVLVPCTVEHTSQGLPYVEPNHQQFYNYLSAVLTQRKYLNRLQSRASCNLPSRQSMFLSVWRRVLGN